MANKRIAPEVQEASRRLVKARKARGLTQLTIAEALGISPTTYRGYERGLKSVPDEYRKPLALVLEVDPSDLFPRRSSHLEKAASEKEGISLLVGHDVIAEALAHHAESARGSLTVFKLQGPYFSFSPGMHAKYRSIVSERLLKATLSVKYYEGVWNPHASLQLLIPRLARFRGCALSLFLLDFIGSDQENCYGVPAFDWYIFDRSTIILLPEIDHSSRLLDPPGLLLSSTAVSDFLRAFPGLRYLEREYVYWSRQPNYLVNADIITSLFESTFPSQADLEKAIDSVGNTLCSDGYPPPI